VRASANFVVLMVRNIVGSTTYLPHA
jgi:hypothetical protein